MLFNSWSYAVFFPVVTLLYFLTPHRSRWILLLLASSVFYMAFVPSYIFILFFAIGVDYVAALLIDRSRGRARRVWLSVSIFSNLSLLCVFKYWAFLTDNARLIASLAGLSLPSSPLHLLLPIGLSFHIFQSLAYIIEVYNVRQKPERHLGIFALYVMFYPQLVAGPIERPQNLLHQFRETHFFSRDRLVSGMERILWGLFKKSVVADRLAILVGRVYDNPRQFTGLPLVIATACFSIQIYCDFSGYCDIALGSAEVMGFRLMENFREPYHARSIAEFWKRWHISLSTWFRDYVYIPLGGSRVGPLRRYRNLLIVFTLSGLWHGASWNFVIWGALHGSFMVIATATRDSRRWLSQNVRVWVPTALREGIAMAFVFVLVSYGWIFFRARTWPDALYISTHLFTRGPVQGATVATFVRTLLTLSSKAELIAILSGVVILLCADFLRSQGSVRARVHRWPLGARWAVYYSTMLAIVLLGAHEQLAFIYFQF